MIAISAILTSVVLSCAQSRKDFTPIELATELTSSNVSSWEIPLLVCIANQMSGLTTGYTHGSLIPFVLSEPHYGLFGIPDRLVRKPGGCRGFNETLALDDAPEDDVRCLRETLDDSQVPRLTTLNKLLYKPISVSKCFDYWNRLPPCYSSNATRLPCFDAKSTNCTDYSGYFTFLLSSVLVMTTLAIIYLSSQILKPIDKPVTLGTVSLTISKK